MMAYRTDKRDRFRRRLPSFAILIVLLLSLFTIGSSEGSPAGADSAIEEEEGEPGIYRVAVVMVIDVSGSMDSYWQDGIKMDSACAAAIELLDILETEDGLPDRSYQAALVEFDTYASVVQPLTDDFDLLRQKVGEMGPLYETNIGDGLEKAYDQLENAHFNRGYLVLLSDGMANCGRSAREIMDWLQQDAALGAGAENLPQASLYGFDYGEYDVNTRGWAEMGGRFLSEAGYNATTFLEPEYNNENTKDIALRRMENDTVFNFNGHGSKMLLNFIKKGWFRNDNLKIKQLEGKNLSRMKLAILAGCKTALEKGNENNICQAFISQGASAAIGNKGYSNESAMLPFLEYFWDFALKEGLSVRKSFNHAVLYCHVMEYLNDGLYREYAAYRNPKKKRGIYFYTAEEPKLYQHDSVAGEIYLVEQEQDGDDQDQDRTVPVYTVGFGDPGDLDEELLKDIAAATGGKYFYGTGAFALSNIFLTAQSQGTGEIVGEFTGDIRQDEAVQAGAFSLDRGESELRVNLNWPGSHVDLRLCDPSGKIVDGDYRGLKIWRTERPAYVVLEKPYPGEWTVELYGQEIPEEVSQYFVVASTGERLPYSRGNTLEFFMVLSALTLLALLIAPRISQSPGAGGGGNR